jgi:hypothetical protein
MPLQPAQIETIRQAPTNATACGKKTLGLVTAARIRREALGLSALRAGTMRIAVVGSTACKIAICCSASARPTNC